MSDPVWLGNYIVPRWEAIALAMGGTAVAVFVAAVVFAAAVGGFFWLLTKSRDALRRTGAKS